MRDLVFRLSATSSRAFDAVQHKVWSPDRTAETRIAEWPSFVRQVFGALYRPDDRTNVVDNPDKWAVRALETVTTDPDFAQMQRDCRTHRVLAMRTAYTVCDGVAMSMDIRHMAPSTTNGAQSDPEEAKRLTKLLADHADKTQDRKDLEAAESQAMRWRAANLRRSKLETTHIDMDVMDRVCTIATTQANSAARRLTVIRGLLAGTTAGELERDSAEVDQLVQSLCNDPLLCDIIDRVGREMVAERKAEAAKATTGNLDIVGVKADDDVSRLTGLDRAMFGSASVMGLDVMRRIVDSEAMCLELDGEEDKDGGDFVVLFDKSSSMGARSRLVTARAVGILALARALRQRRRVTVIPFDGAVHPSATVEKDGAGIAKAIAAFAVKPSGGTDGTAAVNAATDVADGKPVDVLIVTDGEWSADEHAVAEVKRTNAKFHEVRVVDDLSTSTNGDARPWMASFTAVVTTADGAAAGVVASILGSSR